MSVNIEEIMQEIKAEIKEKGYTADMLDFKDVAAVTVHSGSNGDFNSEEYGDIVSYLSENSVVPVSMPIKGNPIIVFIKKLIRRIARVTIRPVTEHQTEYNAYTAHALGMVGTYIESNQSSDKVTELTNRIEVLDLQLRTAMKEIERLNVKIAEMSESK